MVFVLISVTADEGHAAFGPHFKYSQISGLMREPFLGLTPKPCTLAAKTKQTFYLSGGDDSAVGHTRPPAETTCWLLAVSRASASQRVAEVRNHQLVRLGCQDQG